MLGLSAEEDAEFKRSICSDDHEDNDDSPASLEGGDDEDDVESPSKPRNDDEQMAPQSLTPVAVAATTTVSLNSEKTPAIESEQSAKKANNESTAKEHTVELRLLVRRREAGALIGKRGSNIKRLRESFKSSMFSIPDTGNGPERVVCITTNEGSINAILEDLTRLLMEKSPENDEQIELKLLIHSSHAGSIIGIGGQSIKKLRNVSFIHHYFSNQSYYNPNPNLNLNLTINLKHQHQLIPTLIIPHYIPVTPSNKHLKYPIYLSPTNSASCNYTLRAYLLFLVNLYLVTVYVALIYNYLLILHVKTHFILTKIPSLSLKYNT